MYQRIVAPIACLYIGCILCPKSVSASSPPETTATQIILPLLNMPIRKVVLGADECQIVSVKKFSELKVPIIVVHVAASNSREVEDDEFQELRQYISQVGLDSGIEFWTSLGRGRNEIGASFGDGWVAALREASNGPLSTKGKHLTRDDSEIVELLVRRFANRGPVGVVIVSSYFNLDFRKNDIYDSGRFNETSIEPFWPMLGDSGIVIIPVIIPQRRNRPSGPIMESTFSASLFGSKQIRAGGPPGSSIALAIKQLRESSIVEFRAPTRKYTLMRRAPKLKVFSQTGMELFRRPFVVGGEATDLQLASRKMNQSLARIVAPFDPSAIRVETVCGSQQIANAEGPKYLRLASTLLEDHSPKSFLAWVTIEPTSEGSGGMTFRGISSMVTRDHMGYCVGPMNIVSGTSLLIYCPELNWLASVRVN